MLVFALLACGPSATVDSPTRERGSTVIESGDLAVCRSTDEPAACYRAAVQHPDYDHLGLLLTPACLANEKDSCRRYHRWAQQHGTPEEVRSSAILGCNSGDDELCTRLLEMAEEPRHAESREFMLGLVKESRAKHLQSP